jgi:magnesium transporter
MRLGNARAALAGFQARLKIEDVLRILPLGRKPSVYNRVCEMNQDEEGKEPDPRAAADQSSEVANRVEELPASDGAGVLNELSTRDAAKVAEYLDPDTAARILTEMAPSEAATVISDMAPPEASMVLQSMAPDDRVDVLEHVDEPLHAELLREMDADEAAEVRELEQYPSDTAGGIMTTQVTALYEHLTVENAISTLRRIKEEVGQMFYVYVIDSRRHLLGVLSMRDLILARPDVRLRQIMIPNVRSVQASMDQEEVAALVRKLGYLAMPVVDERGRLLGLITLDDIVDVLQEEATEDVQKMFGAGAEERLSSPWSYSFKKRIWWLEVNLATAFLAAWVISWFDDVISALPVLAAYESIVSGMGGNAGAQALAVAIRGMALGESGSKLVWKVLYREAIVGLCAGVTIGLTTWACAAMGVFGFSQYNGHPLMVGFVIFIALTFNHINACTTGAMLPFIMRRCGFDPAQSATIFATTFTDCGGFFATLWLAKVMLHIH